MAMKITRMYVVIIRWVDLSKAPLMLYSAYSLESHVTFGEMSQYIASGTGKTRNKERIKKWKLETAEMGNGGNGKREMKKWAFSFITACPLCIQQHLLERTSATGDSGDEVETGSLCISLIKSLHKKISKKKSS